jgi:thiamine biosynthesis lipoprotein ApbE
MTESDQVAIANALKRLHDAQEALLDAAEQIAGIEPLARKRQHIASLNLQVGGAWLSLQAECFEVIESELKGNAA